MRGKRAKSLRALAQAMTAGLPWTTYTRTVRGTITLARCGRAVYQEAKRDKRR